MNRKPELGPKLLSLMPLSSGERVIAIGIIALPRSHSSQCDQIIAVSEHDWVGKRHNITQRVTLKLRIHSHIAGDGVL